MIAGVVKKAAVQLAWPIVSDLVEKLLREAASLVHKRSGDWMKSRFDREQIDVEERVAEAAQKANSATTDAERQSWQAKAEAWREVADVLRAENASLQRELERLKKNDEAALVEAAKQLTIEQALTFKGDEIDRVSGGTLLQIEHRRSSPEKPEG